MRSAPVAVQALIWGSLGLMMLVAVDVAAGVATEVATVVGEAVPPESPSVETIASPLPPPFDDWYLAARPFLSHEETRAFLTLTQNYQREAFIERFWAVRDPYPETARNELREQFDYWSQAIPEVYGTLEDARGTMLMLHGKPSHVLPVRCAQAKPIEIWVYNESRRLREPFFLVFRQQSQNDPARLLDPGEMVSLLGGSSCLGSPHLADVLTYVQANPDAYALLLKRVLQRPRPDSEEWLAAFQAFSTEIEPDAEPLPTTLALQFPGRFDGRTVVQALLTLDGSATSVADFRGHRSLDFLLVGEVVRGGGLFESFRYRFGVPVDDAPVPARIPLAFQRHLRPGAYQLILRVEDLNGHAMARLVEDIEVPASEHQLPPPPPTDAETARIFAEASAAVTSGRPTLRIVPPGGDILAGFVRFDTLAVGTSIDRVRFLLDDRELMTKTRPPFNVEIDLGEVPQLHSLRVEALDAEGNLLAIDERWINAGANRFAVRLIEPSSGDSYRDSIQARVDVQLPEGRTLERLEFYLDEDLMATLYQPPYVQPIALRGPAPAYIRAVAYLPDGHATEDLVFINSPGNLEAIEVQTVELFTSVLDGGGRPVEGLTRSDFTVREDGVGQTLKRFEWLDDLPIQAGILIDNSASMRANLAEVKGQALQFLNQTITPRDRAAIITFNRFPRLTVPLTSDLGELGGGLAGLSAEGGTSLYDSVVFSLYYFTGIKGKRALLILSDGKDESSEFSFEETLQFARRAGVTVYSVGLRIAPGTARSRLEAIASDTGGQAFFIQRVAELEAVYEAIERELRSQYLLVYQSTNTDSVNEYREVEVATRRRELEVRTLSGYYP
ncbi:MAG: VWA domain-containing protein [Thermoanaerobaculia bacterium]|nr:VWA domain-containing protein [Thermoanaerobaculia bacterium]